MKEKQKVFLFAVIISTIITTCICGLIILSTSQTDCSELHSEAFLMEGIVGDVLNDRPFVPYWQIGLIAFICFIVLTLVFYYTIGKLKQTK